MDQVADGEHKSLQHGSWRCDGAFSIAPPASVAAPPNTQHEPQDMMEEELQGMDMSSALLSQLLCGYLTFLFIPR